jgi:uncharacterized protein (DUF1015 family)
MVEVVPFNGLRYNEEKSGPLAELIAPPYDVIRPNMQEELYARTTAGTRGRPRTLRIGSQKIF